MMESSLKENKNCNLFHQAVKAFINLVSKFALQLTCDGGFPTDIFPLLPARTRAICRPLVLELDAIPIVSLVGL